MTLEVIAIEEHVLTSEFSLKTDSWDQLDRAMRDVDFRIAEMDKYGIDMQVLSLSSPGVHIEPDRFVAEAKAKRSNDEVSEIIMQHPDRLAAFATLAMHNPSQAAKELERCVNELGFKGAMLNHHTNGVYLDTPETLPFWEKAVELNVPIYIHPAPALVEPVVTTGYPGLGAAVWGWSFEAGAHALRLVMSGLFDRLPELQIILGHMAEMLPFCFWRIDSRHTFWPNHAKIAKKPSDYIRENFHATTSGSFDSVPLLACMNAIGADRIMFAVDYPYEPTEEAMDFLKTAPIAPIDRQKIASANARRLLKL